MKVKYSASLALVLWLGVVAWVSAMIVAKPSVIRSFPDEDDSAAIAQLQITLNQNRSMLAAIDALDAVQADSLRGLAVAPGNDKPGSAARAGEGAEEATPDHQLTLIVSEGRRRRAIIDGQLAGTGSRLADGSHVRAIGKDHVVIEDVLGQPMTLRLPPPFASAGQGLR